jgi:hypothetical protein
MGETITCPKCRYEIEVTEALSAQITTKIRGQLEADAARRRMELDRCEETLKARERQVQEAQKAVKEQVQEQLAKERGTLEGEARKKAQEAVAIDLKDKQAQIDEYKTKLKTANDAELALRKKERELVQKAETLELEVNRRLNEERERVREAVKKQTAEEYAMKEADNQKQIGDLRKQIDELKRKAEQGSQQSQGEVLELSLENFLRQHFPFDDIQPVPKGVHGGDVLQQVRDSLGKDCGVILWESKRTKNWSEPWLAKLRSDQRAAKAAQAVILTEAMPAGCDTFTSIEGIWVTNRTCLHGVAIAMRVALMEVANANRAIQGRQTKMDVLYGYLSGPEFRNRVTGIVEAFVTMRSELETEKRALQRIWAKREKQLDHALANTTGFYGDLQGIFGGGLAKIEALELPALEVGSVEDGQAPVA